MHKLFSFILKTYQQMFKCLITLIQMKKTMSSTHKVINNEHLVICFNVEEKRGFWVFNQKMFDVCIASKLT
jgi:hypothetical protein